MHFENDQETLGDFPALLSPTQNNKVSFSASALSLPGEPSVALSGIQRRGQWESRGGDGCQSAWICGYCPALPATPSCPPSPQTIGLRMGVGGEEYTQHHERLPPWGQPSYFLATELPHTLKSRENKLEHTFKVHKCRTKGKYTLLPYIDSFIQKCICKILTYFELGSKQILRQNLKSCRSLVNALGLSLGLCILMSSVMEWFFFPRSG